MHEFSLMGSIIDIVLREIEDVPCQEVKSIKLLVGELSNALPDALEMAFEALGTDTKLAGAKLELEMVPALWQCRECEYQFEQSDREFLKCPSCQSYTLELIKGRDLLVESLEVE